MWTDQETNDTIVGSFQLHSLGWARAGLRRHPQPRWIQKNSCNAWISTYDTVVQIHIQIDMFDHIRIISYIHVQHAYTYIYTYMCPSTYAHITTSLATAYDDPLRCTFWSTWFRTTCGVHEHHEPLRLICTYATSVYIYIYIILYIIYIYINISYILYHIY